MRPILPAWTETDAALHERLGAAIDPERKVLAGNDLLTLAGGDPAELRLEIP